MSKACCGMPCVTVGMHRLRTLNLNIRDEKRHDKVT
jgi:hypothetical protein